MATHHAEHRSLLLKMLDDAFDKPGWHGPNLRSTVWRLTPEQAIWRPGRNRKNIAEITLHCAYWKYTVRRRITGAKRGSFIMKGSNWFDMPARLTVQTWKSYIKILLDEHVALHEAIATAPWPMLCQTVKGPTKGPAGHIFGIAMHDTYHTGQIQTIKALHNKK